jgi:D-xylose transport system substrate-binding protein
VPGWDSAKARTIFASMLDETDDGIGAVVAGNDAIAGSVIAVLRERGLHRIPIAGQDATIAGLRHVLSGDQCMTVLKSPRLEAAAAAAAALRLFRGRKAGSRTLVAETVGARRVPATLLRPVTITRSTIARVLRDGSVTRARLCAGRYAALCERAGV